MVRVGMNAELRWRERARPVDTRLTQTHKRKRRSQVRVVARGVAMRPGQRCPHPMPENR